MIAPCLANDLPMVEDCEQPTYSLDQYESDKELMLELAVKAYKECLFNVVDSHEQSESGRVGEVTRARQAIDQADIDLEEFWERVGYPISNERTAAIEPEYCGPKAGLGEYGVVFSGHENGVYRSYFARGKATQLCPLILERPEISGRVAKACLPYDEGIELDCINANVIELQLPEITN